MDTAAIALALPLAGCFGGAKVRAGTTDPSASGFASLVYSTYLGGVGNDTGRSMS